MSLNIHHLPGRAAAPQTQHAPQARSQAIKIDRIDRKILAVLQRDGRITRADISKRVGLSPTPCFIRIARLEAAGLIRGYHADVDVEALYGLQAYMVMLSLRSYSTAAAEEIERRIASSPFIISCEAVFGSIDYVLRICARSVDHYHEIMAPLAELEVDYTTHPVSKVVRKARAVDLSEFDHPSEV